MLEETTDHPEVIALPPALFGGTLAIGLLLHSVFPYKASVRRWI